MLRLDPAATPLWRTPDSLQFGHDPELARLEGVPPGAEEVISALVLGTDRRGLAAVAAEAGFEDLDALLARLDPVLLRTGPEPPPLAVALDGPEDLTAMARPWFGSSRAARPDVVVILAHHLVPPADTVRALAEDRPHVALVFDDQAAVVGPYVVPGITPCLRCAEEHRLDDPARRAVAAQLLRRGPARTTRSIGTRLAAFGALGDALDALRLHRDTGLEGAALRIAEGGGFSRERRPWHARCSCRSADGPAPTAPARSGTGTAVAPPAVAPPIAPTTS